MALPADHESFRRNGVYTFRLTYGGGTMPAASNPDWLTSTWTQTNWVTEGSPGTLTCLDAGCTKWNAGAGQSTFKGLAKSDTSNTVLDGNGLEGGWYNTVGGLVTFNGGMPVNHGWVADTMTLSSSPPTREPRKNWSWSSSAAIAPCSAAAASHASSARASASLARRLSSSTIESAYALISFRCRPSRSS